MTGSLRACFEPILEDEFCNGLLLCIACLDIYGDNHRKLITDVLLILSLIKNKKINTVIVPSERIAKIL